MFGRLPNPVGIHNRLAGWLKKFWTLDFGNFDWLGFGLWKMDFGLWEIDFGLCKKWTLDFAKNVIERDN